MLTWWETGMSLRLLQQPQSALDLGRDHPAFSQHPASPASAPPTATTLVRSLGTERSSVPVRRNALGSGRRNHAVHNVLQIPNCRRRRGSREADGACSITPSAAQHIHQP